MHSAIEAWKDKPYLSTWDLGPYFTDVKERIPGHWDTYTLPAGYTAYGLDSRHNYRHPVILALNIALRELRYLINNRFDHLRCAARNLEIEQPQYPHYCLNELELRAVDAALQTLSYEALGFFRRIHAWVLFETDPENLKMMHHTICWFEVNCSSTMLFYVEESYLNEGATSASYEPAF
jgi:hypothetical protein